ncbi:MAG: Rieske (2Fe-2S) protein [Rhodopirellula sp.]|nr:Rieske (2Fe-2S) protein [Rhodopirellula sp.]
MVGKLDPQSSATGLPANPQTDPKRRSLLRTLFGSALGLGFTALGTASGLWAAGTARFLFPNVVTKPSDRFKVGFARDFPPGRVETRYKEEHGVWIVNAVYHGKRQIYALRTVCTHLGCITIWQESEGRFKCPCHGSGFSIDGVNFEGPAPRPLERYAIRMADDGQLEVDTSRIFQEELGQWSDPSCYVPA